MTGEVKTKFGEWTLVHEGLYAGIHIDAELKAVTFDMRKWKAEPSKFAEVIYMFPQEVCLE